MQRLFPIILWSVALIPHAAAESVQFSATAVQTAPEGKTMTSRLYVGDEVVRTESSHYGQTRISIMDNKRRIAWMLNPEKQEYVEMRGPDPGTRDEPRRSLLPEEPGSPCQEGREGFTCNKLGMENVNGRQTDKWEFITTRQGQTVRAVFWVDRRLRTPIRKEFPGGHLSELRDIKEGVQPAHMFTVPQGYKKIDLPTQQQGSGASPEGSPRY